MRCRSASVSGGKKVPHLLQRRDGGSNTEGNPSASARERGGRRGGHRLERFRHGAPGGLDRDHRIDRRGRVERALDRRLLRRQDALDEACETLGRREKHCDADHVVSGVIGGEQRRPVDRVG
jgi:hypothetical protein